MVRRHPLPVDIPHAERGDPPAEEVQPAHPVGAMHDMRPKCSVGLAVKRADESAQNRAEHRGPLRWLGAELGQAVDALQKVFPVVFLAFERDRRDAADE